VSAIEEDDNGLLWIGTLGGATTFDGTNWTTITETPIGRVSDILKDNDNNIWIGSENSGVDMYDGTTWTSYFKENKVSDEINSLYMDSASNVWVCHDNIISYGGKLSRYDGTTWEEMFNLSDMSVGSIVYDNKGIAWLTITSTLNSYNGTELTSYGRTGGNYYRWIRDVFYNDDRIWYTTTDYIKGGIGSKQGDNSLLFRKENSIPSNETFAIGVSNDGTVWVGTERVGLAKYDGKKWEHLNGTPGDDGAAKEKFKELTTGPIEHIEIDSNNNVWVSGYFLCRYDGTNWERADWGNNYIGSCNALQA